MGVRERCRRHLATCACSLTRGTTAHPHLLTPATPTRSSATLQQFHIHCCISAVPMVLVDAVGPPASTYMPYSLYGAAVDDHAVLHRTARQEALWQVNLRATCPPLTSRLDAKTTLALSKRRGPSLCSLGPQCRPAAMECMLTPSLHPTCAHPTFPPTLPSTLPSFTASDGAFSSLNSARVTTNRHVFASSSLRADALLARSNTVLLLTPGRIARSSAAAACHNTRVVFHARLTPSSAACVSAPQTRTASLATPSLRPETLLVLRPYAQKRCLRFGSRSAKLMSLILEATMKSFSVRPPAKRFGKNMYIDMYRTCLCLSTRD